MHAAWVAGALCAASVASVSVLTFAPRSRDVWRWGAAFASTLVAAGFARHLGAELSAIACLAAGALALTVLALWRAIGIGVEWHLARTAAPRMLDARSVELGRIGVYAGWVSASRPVVSPAGVVCAAYAAQLRTGSALQPGALLSSEEGRGARLVLSAGEVQVRLPRALRAPWAPLVARVLRPSGVVVSVSGMPAIAQSALEVVSWERVAKVNAPALAVGRLEETPEGLTLMGVWRPVPRVMVCAGAESLAALLVSELRAHLAWALVGGLAAMLCLRWV